MQPVIRKATAADVSSITEIYNKIHTLERAGKVSVGWDATTYPIRETAINALADNSLFVMVQSGKIVASAIINQHQPSAYSSVRWAYPAADNKIGVLHTLVVDPDFGKQGLGKLFVSFFETYCRQNGYNVARLDTQTQNTRPFNMYLNLGYRLAGIRETTFQNLPDTITLAMFEKPLA